LISDEDYFKVIDLIKEFAKDKKPGAYVIKCPQCRRVIKVDITMFGKVSGKCSTISCINWPG